MKTASLLFCLLILLCLTTCNTQAQGDVKQQLIGIWETTITLPPPAKPILATTEFRKNGELLILVNAIEVKGTWRIIAAGKLETRTTFGQKSRTVIHNMTINGMSLELRDPEGPPTLFTRK